MSIVYITRIILIYLLFITIVTFLLFGLDKWKAKHTKWRLSEQMLLSLAILGGSIGAWLGIKIFHHKTLHAKFRYGVPLILLVQLCLIIWVSTIC